MWLRTCIVLYMMMMMIKYFNLVVMVINNTNVFNDNSFFIFSMELLFSPNTKSVHLLNSL